ncbi:MAG TPA: bile acid:sodium symporter [Dehalococcoidia bacterium]|nr:bile acid:sodium symporter [Dehalococcoidia bacterium]
MATPTGTYQRVVARAATTVTEPLLLWALLAAAVGVALPQAGQRAGGLVPWLLGAMVFATGITVPPARLSAALRRPGRLLFALVVQFGPLSLLAYALSRLPLDAPLSVGILCIGVAPCEITSGVMTLLAGGDAALGTALVAASLLCATIVTPGLLASYAGGVAPVDRAALAQEVGLAVGAPLAAALLLRWLIAGLLVRRQADEALLLFGDAAPAPYPRLPLPGGALAAALALVDALAPAVAALAVLLLLFIVAGTARPVLLSADLLAAVALSLLLNLAGYAAGWLLFRALREPDLAVCAAVFGLGMREFGVAAVLATAVLPDAAAVAAVYGIVILITAPLLVRSYRRGLTPGPLSVFVHRAERERR